MSKTRQTRLWIAEPDLMLSDRQGLKDDCQNSPFHQSSITRLPPTSPIRENLGPMDQSFDMAGSGTKTAMLEAINPNVTTSNSTQTNSTTIGPFDGNTSKRNIWIMAGFMAAILVIFGVFFYCYRKRAHRKEREAGNINLAISRPNPK
ncbi:hypothetical protein J7T55_009775 [Diaporthe amygdali]|uniref:uncharacterized protein n=1 Tax=Phomopsis amygdali TaxID=1214568 RepID=UPI0022FF224F|nr:uncharacterized protein J7T55_009775 [Diaporthe amygdali]KAJ0116625.1 hypothetical protein J7T55_009775 [Diaporthe amygdali]